MPDAFFRASAGLCVIDHEGRVLAMRRRTVPGNAWQMPQGGIDAAETPRDAALRELCEETGLGPSDVEVVAEHPEWLVYELPTEYRRAKVLRKSGWGQAQKWFLVRARPGAVVVPDGKEFDAFEWIAPEVLLARIVAFRRPVYERVLRELLPHGAITTSDD